MGKLFDVSKMTDEELREQLGILRSNRSIYGTKPKRTGKVKSKGPADDLSKDTLHSLVELLKKEGVI